MASSNKWVFFFFFFIVFACSCARQKTTDRAFFYCKEHLSLNKKEMQELQQAGVKKLYVKFFDVGWNATTQTPIPAARLIISKDTRDWLMKNGVEIIPVIFMTNECLENIYNQRYQDLAERVYKLLNAQLQDFRMMDQIKELQFNCDWTDSTREKYFNFLSYIRMLPVILNEHMTLSAGIYFNQCNHSEKTNIPPVNRAMLYCYDDLASDSTEESLNTFRKEVAGADDYPLPLDVALPFDKTRILFRQNQVSGILQDMPDSTLMNPSIVSHNGDKFQVIKDTLLGSTPGRRGDMIANTFIDYGNMEKRIRLLEPNLSAKKFTISLFYFDSSTVSQYSGARLNAVYTSIK